MNKTEILQKIAEVLENNITEITNALEDHKAASDMDEGDTRDMEDYSQQSEHKEMQYQMQIQLDNAQAGLDRLREFSAEKFSDAKSGALIETDKNWFLLGVSFPSINLNGKELLGVSPESPAFQTIQGKQKGDTFTLGNNTYNILGVQ